MAEQAPKRSNLSKVGKSLRRRVSRGSNYNIVSLFAKYDVAKIRICVFCHGIAAPLVQGAKSVPNPDKEI